MNTSRVQPSALQVIGVMGWVGWIYSPWSYLLSVLAVSPLQDDVIHVSPSGLIDLSACHELLASFTELSPSFCACHYPGKWSTAWYRRWRQRLCLDYIALPVPTEKCTRKQKRERKKKGGWGGIRYVSPAGVASKPQEIHLSAADILSGEEINYAVAPLLRALRLPRGQVKRSRQ